MAVTVLPANRLLCMAFRAAAAASGVAYSTMTLPSPEGEACPGGGGLGIIKFNTCPYCKQQWPQTPWNWVLCMRSGNFILAHHAGQFWAVKYKLNSQVHSNRDWLHMMAWEVQQPIWISNFVEWGKLLLLDTSRLAMNKDWVKRRGGPSV